MTATRDDGRVPIIAVAAAVFLVGSQFYTDLAGLSAQAVPFVLVVPPWAAWSLFALLVSSGGYCSWRAFRSGGIGAATPVPLAIVCSGAVTCAVMGFDPPRSLGAVLLLALACGMHAVTVRFFPIPRFASIVFTAFLGVGIAASLAALIMEDERMPMVLALVNNDRAAGLFTTPNQFAAFLVTFVAGGVAVGFGASRPWLRVLGWTSVGVGLVSMWATYSRGGWIGLAVGALAFTLFTRAWRGALAVVVLSVAVGFLAFGNDRHHESGDAYSRVPAMQAGMTTFELFPLFGVGPAAYDRVHPAVRPATAGAEASFASLHPHNIVLSLLAEEGVVGFAIVAFAIVLFVRAFHARLHGAPPARRRAAFALGAGLVGTLGHGMVDLVAVAEITFVWVPFSALALAVAAHGVPE